LLNGDFTIYFTIGAPGRFLNSLIKISILIVTKNWNKEVQNFSYIEELKDNNLDFEVLLAEGNNPSSQRNLLAKSASGDYLLFLDDDSQPIVKLLERYRDTLNLYPETDVLGGPSLLIRKANFLDGISHLFFSSAFGIGPVKSRYNSLGAIRKATEKDLILCNLLVRKDFFLKTKGFSRNLYPGEENEFLKNQQGSNVLYDPEAIVYREARDSLFLFWKQMFSYGKGRAKHFTLNNFFEYVFLIPLFFALYVVSLPLFVDRHPIFYFPILLHFFCSFATVLVHKNENLTITQKILSPFFFFSGHISYGLGLMAGFLKHNLLKKSNRKSTQHQKVQIHKLKNFKKSSI
jgi:glycosyltransferase involved in cell wall biosynthesis